MYNHIIGTKCCQDPQLEELCERVLSYFWDRLSAGGVDEWPEVEELADDMMVDEAVLIHLFNKFGYTKDQDIDD